MSTDTHFKLSDPWQKRLIVAALGLVILVCGVLYAFPNVDLMTDRCLKCGRRRTYYQIEGAQYGTTIYNLNVEVAGNPSEHHEYTDPEYTHLGMIPRWKLHASGKQTD